MTYLLSELMVMTSSHFIRCPNGLVSEPKKDKDQRTLRSTPTEQAHIPQAMTHLPTGQRVNLRHGPEAIRLIVSKNTSSRLVHGRKKSTSS